MKRLPTYFTNNRAIFIAVFAVIIVVVGSVCMQFVTRRVESPDTFLREYLAATNEERVTITAHYLKTFPVAVLLNRMEAYQSSSDHACHSVSHPMGRAVYKTSQNFTESIRQCGGMCTYGCFHGVLMEMFQTDSDTLGGVIEDEDPSAYLDRVQAMARDLCTKPEVENVVRLRYCYHGLGHVFANIAGTDLQTAVGSCSVLNGLHARYSCASGVFMEYLFSASSTALLNTSGAAPCDQYPQYTSQCYRYKAFGWLAFWKDHRSAMQACSAFGPNKLFCIRSVAQAQAYNRLVRSKEEFEELCGSLSGDERTACVSGAVLREIELNDGDDSEHACDVFDETYRGFCVEYLKKYMSDAAL